MTEPEFLDIKRGRIVQNKGSGESYVVEQCILTHPKRFIAVRTALITNPDEWIVIDEEQKMNDIDAKLEQNARDIEKLQEERRQLQKAKETNDSAPIAVVCDFYAGRRLLLKVPPRIKMYSNKYVSICLETGEVCSYSSSGDFHGCDYRNKQVLR